MTFYDEYSYAEILSFKERLPNKDKSIKNFILIARYYIDCGRTINEVYESIYNLVNASYEGMNTEFIKATTNKAISLANERECLDKKVISFSIKEIEFIHSFDNEPLERILFIMMCLYKCNDCMPFTVSKRFINSETKMNKDMDTLYKLFNVMETEDIFVSKIYQGTIYYHAGSKVEAIEEDSEYLVIASKKNIIYHYLKNVNTEEKFIFCEHCGCIEKRNKKATKQRYCKECAVFINREKSRKNMQKLRNV